MARQATATGAEPGMLIDRGSVRAGPSRGPRGGAWGHSPHGGMGDLQDVTEAAGGGGKEVPKMRSTTPPLPALSNTSTTTTYTTTTRKHNTRGKQCRITAAMAADREAGSSSPLADEQPEPSSSIEEKRTCLACRLAKVCAHACALKFKHAFPLQNQNCSCGPFPTFSLAAWRCCVWMPACVCVGVRGPLRGWSR